MAATCLVLIENLGFSSFLYKEAQQAMGNASLYQMLLI